jgi:5-methylcytosine-specific restriction protein A
LTSKESEEKRYTSEGGSYVAKAVASWSKPDGVANLIARKRVVDGTAIPVPFHADFTDANGGYTLQRPASHALTLLVDGEAFSASLVNVDRKKIATDSLQIRYDSNTALQELLKERLATSYEYLRLDRQSKVAKGKKIYTTVPDSHAEYVAFYATGEPFKYRVELLPVASTVSPKLVAHISHFDEYTLEHSVTSMTDQEFDAWLASADGSASIEVQEGLRKIRKLQRSIITYLKAYYGGRCQLCGYSTVPAYGVDTSEGHHIEYFSRSLNNKPSNLAILCPSHHALLHALSATFDRAAKCFMGDGDQQIPLKINYHL